MSLVDIKLVLHTLKSSITNIWCSVSLQYICQHKFHSTQENMDLGFRKYMLSMTCHCKTGHHVYKPYQSCMNNKPSWLLHPYFQRPVCLQWGVPHSKVWHIYVFLLQSSMAFLKISFIKINFKILNYRLYQHPIVKFKEYAQHDR